MAKIKVLSTEIEVTTANTVSSAAVVRAYAASLAVVTVVDKDDNTKGTFTMPEGTVEFIEKLPTDTISSTATLLCSSVAYTS